MKYKIQIDGLRFYAVVSVLIGHWIAWDAYNPIVKNTPWGHGVILFFVLSGFLITNILLNQKEAIENKQTTIAGALKTFYIRRFFRIFPIYYFLIFFLYYINYPKTREIFLWLLTYTSNIYQGITNEYVGHFNHFWSLAVEEQFYIFWPLLIFIVPKKHLMSFFTTIIIISFLSRMWCLIDRPEDWMLGAYFTPNLLLPLVLGAILALIKQKNIVFYYNFFIFEY
jgi:peptidoglycan/LPS O-acetylase OafA/YrhL